MAAINYVYSIPYIIIFLLVFTGSIIVYKPKNAVELKLQRSTQLFGIILILVLFYGLRGLIFSDWVNYYWFYANCPSFFDGSDIIEKVIKNNIWNWEPGFLIYVVLCKTISSNYFFFQCISFVFDLLILYIFFKYYISDNISLGFLFFISFYGILIITNTLRNAKSIMLFLLSIKYIEQRKFIKYCILNIIGSMFHISALLWIPVFFVINTRSNRYFILFLFILGNIIYLLKIEWCKTILLVISPYIPFRLGDILTVYLYLDSGTYGFTIGYIERIFSFILIFCFSNRLEKSYKDSYVFIRLYYIYAFIFLYFAEFRIFLERITILFICAYWILYPRIYFILNKNDKRIFLMIFCLYGLLKTCYGNRNITSLYENALLEHSTYEQRKSILMKGLDAHVQEGK